MSEFEDPENEILTINKKFQTEYNKKRQKHELSRKSNLLDELSEQEIHSDSESEDEEGKLLSPEMDDKLNDLVKMIRSNDPKLKSINSEFFDANQPDRKTAKEIKDTKTKTSKVRHLIASQLLEKPEKIMDKDQKDIKGETYVEKQKALKNAFIKATKMEETYSDLEFFKEKDENEGLLGEGEGEGIAGVEQLKGRDFLDKYFEGKIWKGEKDNAALPVFKSLAYTNTGRSEDESDIEKQEEFETDYNFRFQEPGGTNLVTYSRDQTSLRTKKSSRKKRRREKKAEISKLNKIKRDEAARLKKVKEAEVSEKLEQIKEIAGFESVGFGVKDLEDAFDGEKFDEKMAEVFGRAFYENEDLADLEDEEDDSRGEKLENSNKKKLEEKFIEIESKLKECSDIDFDQITNGGVKTTFAYQKVVPKNYGLTTDEILTTADKELTKKISIKFLSTYRDDNEAVHWLQTHQTEDPPQQATDNKFAKSEKLIRKAHKKKTRKLKRRDKKGKKENSKNSKNPKN